MKKILIATTISNTINAFLKPHIELLYKLGFVIDIVTCIENEIDCDITKYINKTHSVHLSRNMFNISNLIALINLKKLLKNNKYDYIQTHTPIVSALIRIACINNVNCKIIYTVHGFHFFKGSSIINWLIYYPIEKLLSKYTDYIIVINKMDYQIANSFIDSKNVIYIPSVGINTEKYSLLKPNLILKSKLEIKSNHFILLSVGELNNNKNHITIIKSIKYLNNKNIIYLICGKGSQKKNLSKYIERNNLSNQVKLVGYIENIDDYYSIANVFVFPSKREGLGLAAIEAMAAGLPILTSNVHGINDYSIQNLTGFLCNPTDFKLFAKNIDFMYNNNNLSFYKNINQEIAKKFDIKNTIKILTEFYKNL